MIKISIKKEKDLIEEITILGHADYDDIGKDIVCSAVSSIVITTVNAITMFDASAISYNDSSNLNIKIVKHDEITNKLIINMLNLLEELEKDYPKNIKIL